MSAKVLDRGLPASEEAERAIMGAVLLDNTAYFQASVLSPEDFSLDSHRRIFLRTCEIAERGEPINFVTLTEELGKHQEIESVGGVAYVTSLTDGLPRVKDIRQYVRIVNDKSMLRKLIHSCNRNMAAAYEAEESAQSLIARTVEDVLRLQGGDTEEPKPVSDFSGEVIESLKHVWANPKALDRYSLVLQEMNEKTGGMLAEEYCCLMGRTGDGKTGYACQIALENGLKGRPVLIFPLELSKEIMLRRLLCVVGQISNKVLIKHTWEPRREEVEKLAYYKKILDEAPIYFDDSRELTISQLVAKARQWKRIHCQNEQEGLVIVDYMQKVVSRQKDNRDRMTAISESLRRLAKDEKMRVIGLSQMGRPDGKNLNARPTKFDPKESGSIENDVHLLISAYRPVDEDKMPTGEDELIICKQRDGESASVRVVYRGEFYTFVPR